MQFNLSTTLVVQSITASPRLCKESKHLLMLSGVKGPSQKAMTLLPLPETWEIRTKRAPRPCQFEDMLGTPRFGVLPPLQVAAKAALPG